MNGIHKGELVFVRILFPLISGILVATNLPATTVVYYSSLGLSIFSLCFLWLTVIFYKKHKVYLSRWLPGLITHIFIFLSAVSFTLHKTQKFNPNHFSTYKSEGLVVSITSEPKLSGDILSFEAQVKQGFRASRFEPQSGLLLVALKLQNDSKSYNYGDELLIANDFNEVEPHYNPYEFDFKNYLANRGIYHQTFINEPQIRLLKTESGNVLINYALRIRKKMVVKYNRYIQDKDAAAVASTLILGYKADLSREILSAYSKAGTMHVLSVSGMHVGIIFAVLNWTLGFMSRKKSLRLVRAALMISLIWFYALVTGFSPSVSRAALMLSIYVLGKALSRSSNSYNLVATSAVFLLLYNPYFLFDVGFQLSYLAVLGLIYLQPKIYHRIYIKNWLGDKIWSYVALSSAAQLATFPLGMYYFHQFPVYFLISNLFILLPVVLIMYMGLSFLFIPWHFVLEPVGKLLEKSIVFMDDGLFYIENLPWATIKSYNNYFLYYILMYLIVAAAVMAFQYKSKKLIYCFVGFCFIFVVYRSFDVISSINEKSITYYSLRKKITIGFFDSRKALLYTDLNSSDKALAFSISPSLEAWADEVERLSENRSFDFVYSDGNFLQFKDHRILIWNNEMNDKRYTESIGIDALVLSGSPKVKLHDLIKHLKFRMIFIDGTNYDYMIRSWEREAAELSLKIHVLKKNRSVTLKLN